MASNRSNLALDEQSFQGLLAAAFTIQEHNDRANAGRQFQQTDDNLLPKPEPPKCGQCGAQLPSADSSCPTCSDATLRPGERLQRNWASMWLMSQDLHLTSPPAGTEEGGVSLSPADPGRARSRPAGSVGTAPGIKTQPRPVDQTYPQPGNNNHGDAPNEGSYHDSPGHDSDRALDEAEPLPMAAWPVGTETAENAEPDDRSNAHFASESADALTIVEEQLPDNEDFSDGSDPIETADPEPRGLRVRLRFQRADLYLGLAVLVLAAALFWPSGASRDPKMPTWERIMIAIGVAEEAPPAVHYHGDPDLKVWVDTHTALYYCPGDELYGKSPGGHYSTQRDAQSDRFEPAERSVCVE